MNFNLERPVKVKNYVAFDIETSGLNAFYGSVTCICAIDEQGNEFKQHARRQGYSDFAVPQDELNLIKNFFDYLHQHKFTYIITFNGKNFDIPFLLTRIVLLTGKIHDTFNDIFNYKHIDLSLCTSYYTKMQSYAEVLGVAGKSGTGLEAITLWKHMKYEDLVKYCIDDVGVTIAIYKKLLLIDDMINYHSTLIANELKGCYPDEIYSVFEKYGYDATLNNDMHERVDKIVKICSDCDIWYDHQQNKECPYCMELAYSGEKDVS